MTHTARLNTVHGDMAKVKHEYRCAVFMRTKFAHEFASVNLRVSCPGVCDVVDESLQAVLFVLLSRLEEVKHKRPAAVGARTTAGHISRALGAQTVGCTVDGSFQALD